MFLPFIRTYETYDIWHDMHTYPHEKPHVSPFFTSNKTKGNFTVKRTEAEKTELFRSSLSFPPPLLPSPILD